MIGIIGVIGKQNLGNALKFCSRISGGASIVSGNQHMNLMTKCKCSSQRFGCGILERDRIVIGEKKGSHQKTPASVLSFETSSATEPTLTPALRPAGSIVVTTLRRGATSTP